MCRSYPALISFYSQYRKGNLSIFSAFGRVWCIFFEHLIFVNWLKGRKIFEARTIFSSFGWQMVFSSNGRNIFVKKQPHQEDVGNCHQLGEEGEGEEQPKTHSFNLQVVEISVDDRKGTVLRQRCVCSREWTMWRSSLNRQVCKCSPLCFVWPIFCLMAGSNGWMGRGTFKAR